MRIFYLFIFASVVSLRLSAQCCNFTYQQQTEPATSAATFGVALGDFDNDGDSDVVAVSAYYGVDVYFNNGSGTYTLNAQYATGANHDFYGALIADVDGDNDRDIIVAPFYTSSDFTILKNNGSGVFTVSSFSSNVGTYNFAIGDIDGDGDIDAFLPSGFGGDGKVMKNNGSGSYSVFQTVTAARGHDVALGDVDGDGDLDAFVSENSTYGNSLFLNNGSGTFTQSGSNFGTAGGEVALGDLDGDGDLDAWVGTAGNTSELWINNGSGTFTAGPVITTDPTWGYSKGVVLSDNDGDGDLDVFLCFYSNNPQVWTNNGNLTFSKCYQATTGSSSHGLAVGDINGDGKKDMYVGDFSNTDGDWVFLQGANYSISISYSGSPYSTSISTPQAVTQTGASGGTYSASPNGLTINSGTGDITPSTSTPGVYTVTYTVSGCTTTTNVEIVAAGTPSCTASGNMLVFANYDGGVLNINVDVNIPNLKIGVCTYEPVVINLLGPYASNVTKVIRAGYPNTNNNHCGGITATAINGPIPANYSIINIPPVTLSNPNGYASGIICAYSCNTTSNQGGCNTIDQVLDYFTSQLNGTLYSLTAQYCCWQSTNSYNVSALSNSCCASSSPNATISYAGSPYCKTATSAQAVTFSGTTGGSFSSSPAGLDINTATGEIIPASSSAGNYTVTYSVAGCPSFTTTANLSIVAGASATISYPASAFCYNFAPQTVTLTGNTGGTFSANNSSLAIDSTTGTITPSASTPGTYIVTYSIPSSGPCSAVNASDTIEVMAPLTSNVSASICSGSTYTFGSQTLTASGVYSDTILTNASCDSIVTLTLTVTSLPAPLLSASDSMICSGDSALVCAPSGYSSYTWNVGGNDSCVFARNAGNYYVTVTDANNCTVQSQAMAIGAYPAPSVSISVNGDTLHSYYAIAYQWYLDGTAIPNADDSLLVAAVSGSYQVEITDVNGCKAQSTSVQVNVTGISELNADHLRIYPNPIQNGQLHIDCGSEWLGAEMSLLNATGQVMQKGMVTAAHFDVAIKPSKGIYFIQFRSGQNTVVRKLSHL